MRLLEKYSEGELLSFVLTILSRPGNELSEQDKKELEEVAKEFKTRERIKKQ